MLHRKTTKRKSCTTDEGRTLAWLFYRPTLEPVPHIGVELHYLHAPICPATWAPLLSQTLVEWAASKGAEAVEIVDDETDVGYRVSMSDLLGKGFKCAYEGRHVLMLELNDWTQVQR